MDNQAEGMSQATLHPATHIGLVTLAIASLDRSVTFYERVFGFRVIERSENVAMLGAATGNPLLALIQQDGARPQPPNTTGLYHFAILVPSRADLARAFAHLVAVRGPLTGYSDHLVSEALYLSDPDGNGIELYRDRPRSTWQWHNGQVAMATDPLDLEGLLEEGRQHSDQWRELPPQTSIGHIHLRVADLRQAEQFYHGVLGFDVTAHMPGALFVSAGGYHHHVGLNTWQSRGAPPPPADSVGLCFFTIQLPDQAEQARVLARLQTAGWSVERQGEAIALRDPWGNGILLTASSITSVEMIRGGGLSRSH